MSLRQALQKLRSGTETKEFHVTDNNDDCMEYDFDLSSEFFEPDEFWNTSTPLQSAVADCVNAPCDAKIDRMPLMQICDQSVASRDTSFIPLKHGLPVTSNSSSQKLKSFTFSRSSSHREVAGSNGLPPPSKKPASEKELTRQSGSQHMSFNASSVPSTPSNLAQVNSIITNQVTGMKSSTPITTSGSKQSNETPSLPVTPVSCQSAVRRKFPGPAGLLPKLLPNQSLDDVKLSVAVSPSFTPRSKVTTIVDLLPSSQGDCCNFSGTVWKSAVDDLSSLSYKDNGNQETCCISELLKGRQLNKDQKGLLLEKIPFLVVMLKSVVPQGNGACVTLKDLTETLDVLLDVIDSIASESSSLSLGNQQIYSSPGEMPATFHSKVYEEYQSELIPGTVLILNKVSLFSPSQKRRYLNITNNNILKLFLQNGSVVINEKAKGNDPVSVNSTLRACNPTQNNLLDSAELFNTDISQEWCGFLDDTSTSINVTTAVAIVSTPSASVSNSTNSSTITTAYSHVVTCTVTHNNSFTANSSNNCVQDNATATFTDGLEDEDLDSLLRDFEEDQLCT